MEHVEAFSGTATFMTEATPGNSEQLPCLNLFGVALSGVTPKNCAQVLGLRPSCCGRGQTCASPLSQLGQFGVSVCPCPLVWVSHLEASDSFTMFGADPKFIKHDGLKGHTTP